jgi:hypothetical protein
VRGRAAGMRPDSVDAAFALRETGDQPSNDMEFSGATRATERSGGPMV